MFSEHVVVISSFQDVVMDQHIWSLDLLYLSNALLKVGYGWRLLNRLGEVVLCTSLIVSPDTFMVGPWRYLVNLLLEDEVTNQFLLHLFLKKYQ